MLNVDNNIWCHLLLNPLQALWQLFQLGQRNMDVDNVPRDRWWWLRNEVGYSRSVWVCRWTAARRRLHRSSNCLCNLREHVNKTSNLLRKGSHLRCKPEVDNLLR